MTQFRTRKDGKHYPLSSGKGAVLDMGNRQKQAFEKAVAEQVTKSENEVDIVEKEEGRAEVKVVEKKNKEEDKGKAKEASEKERQAAQEEEKKKQCDFSSEEKGDEAKKRNKISPQELEELGRRDRFRARQSPGILVISADFACLMEEKK